MIRFSSTLMSRKVMRPSGIMVTLASLIFHVGVPLMGVPSSVIVPAPTGSKPMMARSRVVLPAPFGPMMVVSLPCGMDSDTSHSTLMAP
jgi:hypothetical protein